MRLIGAIGLDDDDDVYPLTLIKFIVPVVVNICVIVLLSQTTCHFFLKATMARKGQTYLFVCNAISYPNVISAENL